MQRTTTFLLAALPAITLIGCESKEPNPTVVGGTSPANASVSWMLEKEPEGATALGATKKTVEEGDEVVVVGRIGGRAAPISADSPVFLIVDLDVPHCGDMGDDDHCPTPWDYCCEPMDNLTANSATIQLVDSAGAPLVVDPIAAGLKELDEVVVVGTVGPRPTPEVLTIKASSLFRRTE